MVFGLFGKRNRSTGLERTLEDLSSKREGITEDVNALQEELEGVSNDEAAIQRAIEIQEENAGKSTSRKYSLGWRVPLLAASVGGAFIVYNVLPQKDDIFKMENFFAGSYDCNSISELPSKFGDDRYYVQNVNTGQGDYYKSGELIGKSAMCSDGVINTYKIIDSELPRNSNETKYATQDRISKGIEEALAEIRNGN